MMDMGITRKCRSSTVRNGLLAGSIFSAMAANPAIAAGPIYTATPADAIEAQDVEAGASPVSADSQQAASTQEAEESRRSGVTEIVVTSQRREGLLRNVPASISAFTGDDLQKSGISSATDVALLAPNVSVSNTSSGQFQQFSIRGVTQADFSDHTEAPNAVYIDNVYIASMQAQRFGLFDVERIEVLRGPQGTLFGRNATGGLVHYITNDPSSDTEGSLDLTYGRFNYVRIEGALSVPLTDTLANRFSFVRERRDPIVKNIFPQGQLNNPITGVPMGPSAGGVNDLRDMNNVAIRNKLKWQGDRTEVTITGSWGRERISPGSYHLEATAPVIDSSGRHVDSIRAIDNVNACSAVSAETGACLPTAFNPSGFRPTQFGDFLGAVPPGLDGFAFINSVDHSPEKANRNKTYGGSAIIKHDLGFADLTAISSYMKYEKSSTLDEGGAVPWTIVNLGADHEVVSQEFLVSKANDNFIWTAGLFYLNIEANTNSGLFFPDDSPFAAALGPFITGSSSVGWGQPYFNTLKTDSYAIFGEVEYSVTDQLTFSVGGRVVQENKDYQYENVRVLINDISVNLGPNTIIPTGEFDPVLNPFGVYPSFTGTLNKTLWMGKAVARYKIDNRNMLYASISRGVKAGGFNAPLNDFSAPIAPSNFPYKDETLIAYEAGTKLDFLDGRLSANAAAFYYDYSDYQAFQFTGIGGLISNVDARLYGAELEVVGRPTDELQLSLSGGYLNSKIKDLSIADQVIRDTRTAFSPKYTLSGRIRYKLPLDVYNGDLSFDVDGKYTSAQFSNNRNFAAERLGSYTIFNASVNWRLPDSGITLGAYVKNLANNRYDQTLVDLSTLCGCSERFIGDPRTWGVQMGFDF